MQPSWTDVVQALCACITLLATVGGFAFVIYQIRLIDRQMRGDTHGTIYEHYSKINERLLSEEHLAPYFSNNQEVERDDPNDDQVKLVAEMFVDFFEHVALQRENLPPESVDCWEKACYLRYSKSPEIRAFLEEHRSIYAPCIFAMIKDGEAKLRRDQLRWPKPTKQPMANA